MPDLLIRTLALSLQKQHHKSSHQKVFAQLEIQSLRSLFSLLFQEDHCSSAQQRSSELSLGGILPIGLFPIQLPLTSLAVRTATALDGAGTLWLVLLAS